MISMEYREAITEVLDILKYMKKEDTNKISNRFMAFLEENKSKNYTPKFDHTKTLKELKLKEKTKNILSIIYINYWCNNEEKIKFKQGLIKNEKKYQNLLREKYNPDNIFKRNKSSII